MSDISAGQQKTLIAFEARVANTEKLSHVRGKGRGRKEGREGMNKEETESSVDGNSKRLAVGVLVIFSHPPLA